MNPPFYTLDTLIIVIIVKSTKEKKRALTLIYLPKKFFLLSFKAGCLFKVGIFFAMSGLE